MGGQRMRRDRTPEADDEVVIHLRVPGALKGRWVRASRARGQRLTDWIVAHVESSMLQQINIPAELDFADLKLARDADGHLSFDASIVARIAAASGLRDDWVLGQPEDVLAEVLARWYRAHRAAGGAPDPVQEDLIAETRLEDARGGGLSYPPGRA